MRAIALAALLTTCLALCACGPAHTHEPLIEQGRSLDLSVKVSDDHAPYAKGLVHWRLAGEPAYKSAPLTKRGNELWHTLDVSQLPLGATVEYYFDIDVAGELHPVRSPTDPYTTTIATHHDVIWSKLEPEVHHGGPMDPITFRLDTNGVVIDRAEVLYFAPHIHGRVIADLDGWGSTYKHTIDPKNVSAGRWEYCIKVYAAGRWFELPPSGYASFFVRKGD